MKVEYKKNVFESKVKMNWFKFIYHYHLKYKFWLFVHNFFAHPFLISGTKWADKFHEWTAKKCK